MVSETEVALVGLPGVKVQVDALGRPVHVYVIGRTVCELVPLFKMNEGVLLLLTVIFTALVFDPWATESVPPEMLEPSVKLSVVAVTLRFTVVVADAAPLVPFTVTATLLAAAMLAVVEMTSVLEVASTAVKVHVAPVGKPVLQENETVPLNPFCGVIVIVVLPVLWPATAVREAGLGDNVKLPAMAIARWFAFTEPRPATRLNPVVASPEEAW